MAEGPGVAEEGVVVGLIVRSDQGIDVYRAGAKKSGVSIDSAKELGSTELN